MILKNKTALITGGSRGIGLAIAHTFAREGANLFLVARKEEELTKAASELKKNGARVEVYAGDVSDEHAVEEISKKLSTLDILVNAAGIYGPIGRIEDTDVSLWRKTLDVNLTGTFLFTKMVIPFMKKQGGGKIVNFAGGGEGPRPRILAYVASKGGIIRFTESVAADLLEYNIYVNAISPGGVNTKFLDELIEAGVTRVDTNMYNQALNQKKTGGVSPEKAAALCVFLASSKSNGLSGKVLSAVHDDYENFPSKLKNLMSSDAYTYRRIKPHG